MKLEISEKLRHIIKEVSPSLYDELIKIENPCINYLDFAISNKNRISFIYSEKVNTFNNVWCEDEREKKAVMTKVGRTLNKLVTGIHTNVIEKIQAKMMENQDLKFEIVEGERIRELYLEKYYNENQGTLNNSCMRYSKCQEYFDVYVNHCKMLVLWNDDDTYNGRAILWELKDCVTNEKVLFLDRIYGTNQTVELFKSWAISNGYIFKNEQSYSSNKLNDGVQSFEKDLFIDINEYELYPYMDTMKFLSRIDNILYINSNHDYTCTLDDVDGNDEGEWVVCEECGERIYYDRESEYIINGEHNEYSICTSCYDNGCYINIDGELYQNDDSRIAECIECGDYFLSDASGGDTINGYVCEECMDEYVYVSGCEYYPIDRTVQCEECGCYEIKDDALEIKDSEYVCYSCKDAYTFCNECEEYHKEVEEFQGLYYCEDCIEEVKESYYKKVNKKLRSKKRKNLRKNKKVRG